MHLDLERVVAEDETARAQVDTAASMARARVAAAQAELARARDDRLHRLQQQVDEAVATILEDTDREVTRRRSQRERDARERAARADAILESAVDVYVRIVRDGPDVQVEP